MPQMQPLVVIELKIDWGMVSLEFVLSMSEPLVKRVSLCI